MSQSEAKEGTQGSKRGPWIKLGVVALDMLFIGVAIMSLPKGYSDDLSMLGKGKVAIVLIRDKNAVESFEMQNVMDSLRELYSGKIEFLLTDFNTSQGKEFMAISGSDRTDLVLVNSKGQPVKALRPPQTPRDVQREIITLFGINP